MSQRIDDFVDRWGITPAELRRRHEAPAEPSKPSERRCALCDCRVTETPSGREVGHAAGERRELCPDHPDADSATETTVLQSF
jgi:hypothetical protein